MQADGFFQQALDASRRARAALEFEARILAFRADNLMRAGDPRLAGDVAAEAIHWGFGALTGAAYGGLVEYYPSASVKDDAGFGMALSSLTHGTVLPAMGLAAKPEDQTSRERTSEMASHVVYGVVTETVRRVVRRLLR